MTSINLSIDFGGSGIKAIASVEGKAFWFRLAPEVIEMLGEPPRLHREFAIDLSQNLWVGNEENRHAVGLLARTSYLATIPLAAPKADYVVPRTMAALAMAMSNFGVSKCGVNLQLLFPSAEFERTDSAELIRSLKSALSGFDSATGKLKAKLTSINIYPEGWGLTRRFMSMATKNQSLRVACIMFGHRNTSLYLCAGGQPSHYRSNDKGFIRAIEYAKLDHLEGLKNPRQVDDDSLQKYWLANKNWLIENLPSEAAIAIIGGGPLAMIGDPVREFLESRLPEPSFEQTGYGFGRRTSVIADGGLPDRVTDGANLLEGWPSWLDLPYPDRKQFSDVYCLWATGESIQR